uniref:Uncharacterized protein n=1 Tax=Oryza sativa subsp. indica TaxID=39946 RepID=A0A679B9H8_ORYSI|nr:hypothetical protein [Oryza sativa Indica Group]
MGTRIFIQVRALELSVLTRSRQQGSLPPRIRIRQDQRQRYVSPISIRRHRRGLAMLISGVDIRRLVLVYVGSTRETNMDTIRVVLIVSM